MKGTIYTFNEKEIQNHQFSFKKKQQQHLNLTRWSPGFLSNNTTTLSTGLITTMVHHSLHQKRDVCSLTFAVEKRGGLLFFLFQGTSSLVKYDCLTTGNIQRWTTYWKFRKECQRSWICFLYVTVNPRKKHSVISNNGLTRFFLRAPTARICYQHPTEVWYRVRIFSALCTGGVGSSSRVICFCLFLGGIELVRIHSDKAVSWENSNSSERFQNIPCKNLVLKQWKWSDQTLRSIIDLGKVS